MSIDIIFSVFFILLGLFFVIRFRHVGRVAIEQRKKINRLLPFKQSEKDFDESAVILMQIMFLVIGALFILIGISSFVMNI